MVWHKFVSSLGGRYFVSDVQVPLGWHSDPCLQMSYPVIMEQIHDAINGIYKINVVVDEMYVRRGFALYMYYIFYYI